MSCVLAGGPAYAQAPANDECDTATVIPSDTSALPFMDFVDTTTATENLADPLFTCTFSEQFGDGPTVWYQWTPSADVTVDISTDGSTYQRIVFPLDTRHGVYTGSCAALTEVACVDLGLNDNLEFGATAGETYYLKFGEFGCFPNEACGGNLVVTITEVTPEPAVLLQRLGAAVTEVGPGSSLADKIALAQVYLAVPDVQSTCEALNAFRNQVRAQQGKKLAEQDAVQFDADAQQIMDAIGCN